MPSYTTNYNLHKIELADKPADITVINPNWDFIDQMLKTLEESASGAFITAEDLHTIEKTSIVQADSNTLNTPYKDSLTSATNGTCVVSVTGNNKTLFYICNGVTNPVYIQSCISGVWNNWKTIIDDAYVTIDQLENYVPKSEKGAANGVATLDENGKIPDEQLPDPDFDALCDLYGYSFEREKNSSTKTTITVTVDETAPVVASVVAEIVKSKEAGTTTITVTQTIDTEVKKWQHIFEGMSGEGGIYNG